MLALQIGNIVYKLAWTLYQFSSRSARAKFAQRTSRSNFAGRIAHWANCILLYSVATITRRSCVCGIDSVPRQSLIYLTNKHTADASYSGALSLKKERFAEPL